MSLPIRDAPFDRWFFRLWLAFFIAVVVWGASVYMIHQLTTCAELRVTGPQDNTCEFTGPITGSDR